MLVLGLILIIAAALALLVVIVGGSNDPARLAIGAVELNTNAMWLFIAGAVTLLVLVVGLDLMRTGLKKANQRRKDSKELGRLSKKVRQQEEEKRRLQAERDAEAERAAAADSSNESTTETPVVPDNHETHGNHTREI